MWSAILGALVILLILLMLAAFHQVVQGAVEQSEVRRQSMAQQAEETSRCIGIGNNQARKDCLERLTSAPSQNQ